MKIKISFLLFVTMLVLTVMSYGADDRVSSGNQAVPQSLGGQAGEAARQLKTAATANLSTAAAEISESSGKMEAEARKSFKTLQQQWDAFARQFQEQTRQIQKQLTQQLQDFDKAFHEPQK